MRGVTAWRVFLLQTTPLRRMVQGVEKYLRRPRLMRLVPNSTDRIGPRPGRGDRHLETNESLCGSLGRATRLPHGAWRRPEPVAARKCFRFWPAAISNPWMFAFHKRRNRSRRQRAIRAISPETAGAAESSESSFARI